MKCFVACLFILLQAKNVWAISQRDSLLNELDKAIKNAQIYDSEKIQRINFLKGTYKKASHRDLQAQYDGCLNLYEEYKSFKFDSAFVYAKKMEDIAARLNDISRINNANIKISFILLSAGLFKETFSLLIK